MKTFIGDWHAWAANTSIIVFIILASPFVFSASLKRSSAALRHRIWCLAFCGSILVPALLLFLPQIRLPLKPNVSVETAKEDPLRHSDRSSLQASGMDKDPTESLVPVSHAELKLDEGTQATVL